MYNQYCVKLDRTGIFINFGNSVSIISNNIHNTNVGISVSNSSAYIKRNFIDNSGDPNSAITGISIDNSYSPTVTSNTVTGYQNGIYLYNSSPTIYANSCINNNTSGAGNTVSGLFANYQSSPRLTPTITEGITSWDAGLNTLESNSLGSGMYIWEQSRPNTDYGYNTIFGYNYYIYGWIGDPFNQQQNSYYTRDNCWVDAIPDPNKFRILDADVYYEPYTCSPPGGGGEPSEMPNVKGQMSNLPSNDLIGGENKSEIQNPTSEILGVGNQFEIEKSQSDFIALPPPPRIVDYGNGVYDTIRVTNHTSPQTADQVLFSHAVDNELNGSYSDAITKYHTIIQNYRDSTTAITSMKKILYCHDKMHADTSAYVSLRGYYQNLVQTNPTDTPMVKNGKEMASKCLVRLHHFTAAINEYENVVTNSHDSLEVLCAQLNIIETYMIMQNTEGDNSFTGQYTQLKPSGKLEGIRMINRLLHHFTPRTNHVIIPKTFNLAQNYPNPFNPTTTIKYDLPIASKVNIKIYDILGRIIKELVNETKEAGSYSVSFDGSNFASGVYFYRIEADENNGKKFINSKKMVLVK